MGAGKIVRNDMLGLMRVLNTVVERICIFGQDRRFYGDLLGLMRPSRSASKARAPPVLQFVGLGSILSTDALERKG